MQNHYENSLQHLHNELKRIDLLIHYHIESLREERHNGSHDEFRGLFISEEEIDGILKTNVDYDKSNNPSSPHRGETKELRNHLQELNNRISQNKAASLEKSIYLSLSHLGCIFQLSAFEIDCLLICLAPELDLKYERLYAYIQNDVTKKRPTVDLVLKLLCHSHEEKTLARPFFSARSQLFRHHLIKFSDEPPGNPNPLLSRPLKLDDRIVEFLLDFQGIEARIRPFAMRIEPQTEQEDIILSEELKVQIDHLTLKLKEAGAHNSGPSPFDRSILYLKGPPANGQQQTAEAVCNSLGLSLLVVDVNSMVGGGIPLDIGFRLIFREALLQTSAVYFKGLDRLLENGEKDTVRNGFPLEALDEFLCPIFLEGEKDLPQKFRFHSSQHLFKLEFPIPSSPIRKRLWKSLLNGYHVQSGLDTNILADRFQLTEGQTRDAIQTARNLSFMRDSGNSPITIEDLYEGCRTTSNQKLASLSRKILPRYGWNEIVLPDEKRTQLKEICNYVKYRHVVYDKWGFDKKLSLGKGLNALFFGSSGTGKTMAAEVIARDLGLDLYKIDLSTVVSKFIGETEKNLSTIFKEAETSNSIIFFDEADALFGKRSEVKDAHDRYANIEVGYLLQKMEEYEGIVILATNLIKNMDDAFVRRIHCSIELPFPNDEQRKKIWKITFPEEAPRDEDIDFEFLSKKFKIAGGNIKNIILSAAFLAAENSEKINMRHIILATKREFQKMGRLCIQSDFGKYYNLTLESAAAK